jgi:hypothetical protein
MMLAIAFNFVGFWRYSILYRRYLNKKLTRKDMILNPFYTLCDLPWLALCIILLIASPWRFLFTFWKMSRNIEHFPNEEVRRVIDYSLVCFSLYHAVVDYVMLPVYLISLLQPFHWKLVLQDLIISPKNAIEYKSMKEVERHESLRINLVIMVFKKTLHDIWQYLLLFPLNLASLYYVPLF